ncbi:hypotheical protein [Mycobacterium phage PP]|uniref:Hypotheical protein n=1 Tax=Mycobacterium phage PP TaxID=2077134 RepID=A0A2Z5XVJ7_9CAUD|nr:hypothetical protein KIW36_gp26 [Mycobacterium phage PP]BBC53865.1 hypotheical protein [Mycobacterium phage PP]
MRSQPTTILALSVAAPGLLFAHTHSNPCGTFLAVYRSPVVYDDDPVYQPVAEVLETFDAEVIGRETYSDPEMFFGRGDAITYTLREK